MLEKLCVNAYLLIFIKPVLIFFITNRLVRFLRRSLIIFMAIKFKKENAADYNFNMPKDVCIYLLSVERAFADDWSVPISEAVDFISDNLPNLFFVGGLHLWFRTFSNWEELSRVRKARGNYWRNEGMEWIPSERCSIFNHVDEKGNFYSFVANLESDMLYSALETSRRFQNSVLFISEKIRADSDEIDSFLSGHYGKKHNSMELEDIIGFFVSNGMILIRTFGNFDDREFDVQFFGKEEVLEQAGLKTLLGSVEN